MHLYITKKDYEMINFLSTTIYKKLENVDEIFTKHTYLN